MKRAQPLLGLAMLATLGACSSAPSKNPGATSDPIVGVDDLGALEKTFGLVPDDGAAADITKASCYQALVADPAANGQFEYRRSKNGAAYFAKRYAGANSGDHRPIVLVDGLAE